MLSLRDEGIIFALQGNTSLEEVLRVTQSADVDESMPMTGNREAA